MSIFYNDLYKNLPEKEEWVLLLLGHYALNKLLEKYCPETKINQYNTRYYCSDKRRLPTIRKHFEALNLVRTSYSYDSSFELVEPVIMSMLINQKHKPPFNATGVIPKKESYYTNEKEMTVTNLGEVYKDIEGFDAYEVIYIYLHQTEYDFKLFKTTYSHTNMRGRYNYGSSETISYTLKVFPKELLGDQDQAIIDTNVKKYAEEHAREILTETFDYPFETIAEDKPYFSKQDVYSRLQNVNNKIALLLKVQEELTKLNQIVDELGESNYLSKVLESSHEYLSSRAPLWINEKDADKKLISTLFLKGSSTIETEKKIFR